MATIDSGPSTEQLTTQQLTSQQLTTRQLTPEPWPDDVDEEYLDQEDELPGRPIRKRIGPFTIVLFALALGAIAFYGGVTVEKRNVKNSGSAAISALASRFRGATGAAGGTGAAGAGAGAAAGAGSGRACATCRARCSAEAG